jgi:hypothetical protein
MESVVDAIQKRATVTKNPRAAFVAETNERVTYRGLKINGLLHM